MTPEEREELAEEAMSAAIDLCVRHLGMMPVVTPPGYEVENVDLEDTGHIQYRPIEGWKEPRT